MSVEVLFFPPENYTIASGEVNTPDIIPCLAHWIPFESEQKQKFQIKKSPPVLRRHENTAYL